MVLFVVAFRVLGFVFVFVASEVAVFVVALRMLGDCLELSLW